MSHRLVVVGAGYACLPAAKRLARRLHRHDVTVTLVNASDRFVERVRLRSIGYDTLVYAGGSQARFDGVPGAAEHVHAVAAPEQAMRLRYRVAEIASGGTVAVVGGGLTGLETASELPESHPWLCVRLFTSADDVGTGLAPRGRTHLRHALDRLGVSIRPKTVVTAVREDGLDTRDGRPCAADAVVWTTGFRAPDLAGAAGFATDQIGRILVDATLRSISLPEVYAIGDAAAGMPVNGTRSRMSCQAALPMGRGVADVVAARLTGREPGPRTKTPAVATADHATTAPDQQPQLAALTPG
ncbi:NAD(P)/FAD-dependent oxidoreductase [Streptomyces sp. NPDC087300]|uniref:NAD(P)/FAD-dependent oxidoreductase n=1 Tax=Streptomyces sp. NPDC087300 TaxID=3365780 RepID=UPI00380B539A